MEYYNEQLKKLQQQVARKKKLESMLRELRSQRETLAKTLSTLDLVRKKEQEDVDKLEGKSLSAFFYAIMGQKEERLDKERKEALEAIAKYDVAFGEFNAVDKEVKAYEDELFVLRNCEQRYEQLLKEKSAAIKMEDVSGAKDILELEEKNAFLESQKKEINEAISAGKKAQSLAEDVLSELHSAEGWSIWDLAGGGLAADVAKYYTLDSAQELVGRLQIQLRRFKTELVDVTLGADMTVNIDGFLSFADCFFDGIFTDYLVYDQIRESQGQMREIKNQIKEVLRKLSHMLVSVEKEQKEIKARLDEKIIKTM